MVEKYKFTDDLLTGNNEIDSEHKYLFKLINTAVDDDEKNEIPKTVLLKKILKGLDNYATNHFVHEEEYMQEIDDPELSLQKKEHMAFINYIEEECEIEITEENAAERLKTIIAFGAKWLYYHIMGSDNMIGAFRKSDIEDNGEPFRFKNEYVIGITFIDDGNIQLFELLRKIDSLIDTKNEQDTFDDVMKLFTELLGSANTLFTAKEGYMERIEYAGLEEQHKAHQSFLKKISRIDIERINDDRKEYMKEFVLYIANWLGIHILKEDKQIPKE
ncbi:MAG: hypothetical protein K6F39_03830 [Lachnospiraceae bacterium]|nr:hypothetical protein [Lachnospiraceae bacterium]